MPGDTSPKAKTTDDDRASVASTQTVPAQNALASASASASSGAASASASSASQTQTSTDEGGAAASATDKSRFSNKDFASILNQMGNFLKRAQAVYHQLNQATSIVSLLQEMDNILERAEAVCHQLDQATSRKRPRPVATAATDAPTARPAQRRRVQRHAEPRPQGKPAIAALRAAHERVRAKPRAAQAGVFAVSRAEALAAAHRPALPASAAAARVASAQPAPRAQAIATATSRLPAPPSNAASMFGTPTKFTAAEKEDTQALHSASNTQQAPGSGPTTR